MTQLEVGRVTRRFGALAAVHEVSFELEGGVVCGLVGPNGSGKSTLLNVLSGVLAPSEGTVVVDGEPIGGAPPHVAARRRIGRTFQLLRLLKGQTVLENVLVGTHLTAPDSGIVGALLPSRAVRAKRAAALGRAKAALARLGIQRHAPDDVEDLSFGVQRKVELARALVAEPSILLLDEPASGLDERSIAELGELVREERARGTAVLLVDHHLEFVLDVCERVLVMDHGELIFDGSAADAPADPKVREAYIGA